ncbi:MAG TPA: sensor domain-containing diguanylate cyclase [Candidatus Limnocylindria bacterium]|jgi:diguanylate cyclase (GGDEF)-like protein|nr:sensor domain-containing diguanylate cyclase [Candidatus Limnocylindria bacterium]
MLARRSSRSYLAALFGAALVYTAEQLTSDAYARQGLADFAWTGAALGAVVGTARAVRCAKRVDRLTWLFFLAGSVAWLFGQLARDVHEVARVPLSSHLWIDLGFLAAAPLWTIGLVLFLRRHGQRLALYALVLDVGAVVLTLAAGVMVYVSDLLLSAAERDPGFAAVAVLYPVLYMAATGAALSVVWGMPPSEPRGAVTSLFVGLGLNALAFTLHLPSYLEASFVPGTLLDPLWIVGMAAIGIAGAQWIEDSEAGAATALSSSAIQFSRMALPGVVAAASAFLLVYTDLRAMSRQVADIIDGAVAVTVVLLATRAGIALFANWQLGERERRRAEQLAALYDVGLATAGELSLDELSGLIAREATALTRTDGAMVALAQRDGRFVVRAQHNAPALGLRVSVGESLRGVALEAIRTRGVVDASDYRAHPDSNPLLHDLLSSAIAAPLIAHGEIVGTLTAYARQRRVFSEETKRLVRLFAAQAAIAIANADLVAETRRLARDDDLTGVFNRRSLMERLEAEIAAASRHGDLFAVVLCDLDGLKAVNDSGGHLVGNDVLKTVARAMRESARAEDVVARFGGDEFVLLLPRTGPLPAQALVGRIAARLRDERYTWAGRANPIPRVSFGIAWFPEDGRDADTLLGAADARMYEDKVRARGASASDAAVAD